jgi:glycosyltransferase involved in cell wall biosynthesis
MKVALVYDRVNKWGGAERLLLALKKIFPQAYLYTSVADFNKAEWATQSFNSIKTSFIQKIPFAKSRHDFFAGLMPLAFESFNFDEFDLVISVTSEAAKGIITKPKTRHICICLTPTRYLWSGYEFYFRNKVFRRLAAPVTSYLRIWDKVAAQRPDSYIAISKEVEMRIKKYYGRESKLVYPPVMLRGPKNSEPKGKYFLVVSRLVPYKRVDLAIKACNKLKLPLVVVGEGSKSLYLKMISGPTIRFVSKLTDEKLSSYYKNCRALIFPGLEDFGLSMAEAQSMGAPVIAYRAGGALEIVKEGETGEFFDKQDPQSLTLLLAKWNDKRYNRELIIKSAQRFSFNNFRTEILNTINL